MTLEEEKPPEEEAEWEEMDGTAQEVEVKIRSNTNTKVWSILSIKTSRNFLLFLSDIAVIQRMSNDKDKQHLLPGSKRCAVAFIRHRHQQMTHLLNFCTNHGNDISSGMGS